MSKSIKNIVQTYNAASQKLLTDTALEIIAIVNNVIHATALAATVKLNVKANK